MNNRSVTGMGATADGDKNLQNDTNPDNQYNGIYGVLASTTGNVYGIYDISGGRREFVSDYKKMVSSTADTYYTTPGSYLIKDGTKFVSDKYKSVMEGNASPSNSYINSINAKRVGEAIWEVSTQGTGYYGWFQDYTWMDVDNNPFFIRGGIGSSTSSGIFAIYATGGGPDFGYRAVLCIE